MTSVIKKSLARTPLITLFVLCLAGCGFHLRGMVDMPPWLNNIAIILQEGHPDLGPLLQEQLQAYNINVVDGPSLASYWLFIESDNFQQQITSVSSSTTPRQYQLIYTVRFKLQSRDGKELISATPVVVTRQITVNSDRMLGSDEEEAITKHEMRRDAAMQILNRLGRSS